MRFSLKIFAFSLIFVSIAGAQDLTREQKLQKIDELNSQIRVLETDVLLPDAKDLKQAEKEGFEVFRLMPRERYDYKFTVQGGGAYYSFTTKSHDYQQIAQIELAQNYLSVGFAGADYGFIADLGSVSLASVTEETNELSFLFNYKPPTKEVEVRSEQRKTFNYETENATYRSRVLVSIGHSYALRAISFDRADVLVAFKIHRKDADGSLIIFWKTLAQFENPVLIRSEQSYLTNAANFISVSADLESNSYFSGNLAARIQEKLRKKGFNDVRVSEVNEKVVLRGTVPKGKLPEVVQLAQEMSGCPVRVELTEK